MDQKFRKTICQRLRERNKKEKETFAGLIERNNKLFEQVESFRTANVQLTLQNEKLRQESLMLIQGAACGASNLPTNTATSSIAIQQLEQKVYKLQEELTDMHRRKGENAQQLVELNQCLQERDKILLTKENRISDIESELMLAKEELMKKDNQIADLSQVNQILKDEYDTISLEFKCLEEKFRKAQEENRELIDRWMSQKARDAERLNAENDAVRRKRQIQVEEQLKEAAVEPKLVVIDDKFASSPFVCLTSSLPVKSYLNFDAHEGEVNDVMFSPQGKIVATCGADRKLKLWDVSHGTAEAKGTLLGSNAGVTAVDFDGEESLILGASNDYATRVWTVLDHRLRHTLTGHSNKVMTAKFLCESSKVVTGSHDRTLKIWDLRSRACTRTMFAGSSCNDVVASDGAATTVISGHFDKKIRFWDTRTEQAATEVVLPGKITSLALSGDGFYLLCCARDDHLRVLDLRGNKVIGTYSDENFHVGADYTKAVFSPDGAYIAAGANNGSVYIWNTNSMSLEKTLSEHSSCVVSCSWHPNGQSLISCDRTKKVVCWCGF